MYGAAFALTPCSALASLAGPLESSSEPYGATSTQTGADHNLAPSSCTIRA